MYRQIHQHLTERRTYRGNAGRKVVGLVSAETIPFHKHGGTLIAKKWHLPESANKLSLSE